MTYYYDHFDNENLTEWKKFENGGNIVVENSLIKLKSSTQGFPYLYGKFTNVFATDVNSVVEFRFKVNYRGDMGNGISIGFTGNTLYPFYQFSLWQDQSSVFSYMDYNKSEFNLCSPTSDNKNLRVNLPVSIDEGWHVLRIESYIPNNWYSIYIDKDVNPLPLYSSRSFQCVPQTILIGNPLGGGGTNWSEFWIDYVRSYTMGDEPIYPSLTPTLTPAPTNTLTPTPTLTPTSTPTPTPTNTPTLTPFPSRSKVIFIPGMGASWNSEALVYNKSVSDTEWKMTPFVRNYDSLIKTLENGGYEKDKDLLIWSYDWRKPLDELVGNLNKYIDQEVGTDEKLVIVGHSMGGVVGRLWLQNHPDDTRVKQVISAGSPQSGAMDPYTIWNSGRVSGDDSVTSVALNILLQLQKDKFDTKVKVLRNFVPSMADLIPVYDFVKKNGKVVSHRDITFHNDYLFNANQDLDNIYPNYRAIVGTGYSTPAWIILGERDWIDKVLGYWPDGSLRSYVKSDGDGTVITKSQFFESDPEFSLKSSHGEITDKSVSEIAGEIGIENAILVPGIDLNNTRLFFIGSPANITAKCKDKAEIKSDNMGFLLLSKNQENCQVSVVGIGAGTYHLVTGIIGQSESWHYFENETVAGKVDLVTENNSIVPVKKYVENNIKRDLKKIGLSKYISNLEKGDTFTVLHKVLLYRRTNSETAVTTRLVENLESIIDRKSLMFQSVLYGQVWNVLPNKKMTIVDALNVEMAKKYLAQAKELSGKYDFWKVIEKMVVANMLVTIR